MKNTKQILFQGVATIYNLSFAKHNGRGRSYAMMATYCEIKIKRDDRKTSKGMSDMNWMPHHVHNLFKLKNFVGQQLATTKAIIELTDS